MGGRLSNNGKNGFEELFRRYYRPVMGFYARRGCPEEECRDLTQETFLRAHRAYGGYQGDAKPLTWLLTIATNLWRNRVRDAGAAKRTGIEVPMVAVEVGLESGDRPRERAIEAERRQRVRDALAELPPSMRRCVYLRVYQERSYREIARLLEVTVETAKSQVSRAAPRLRSILAEDYPELSKDREARAR